MTLAVGLSLFLIGLGAAAWGRWARYVYRDDQHLPRDRWGRQQWDAGLWVIRAGLASAALGAVVCAVAGVLAAF